MYRVKVHYKGNRQDPFIKEMKDEDDLRNMVDDQLDDLENGEISAFTVSSFNPLYQDKPFWEK